MGLSFLSIVYTRVERKCVVQAGQELPAENLRRYSWDRAFFEWKEEPDTVTPGTKEGIVFVFPFSYHVTIVVEQTENNVADNDKGDVDKEDVKKVTPTQTPLPEVKDTEAPIVTAKQLTLRLEDLPEKLLAEMFLEEVQDASTWEVRFATEPDVSDYGMQTVRLIVQDSAGNFTEVDTVLNLVNAKKILIWELGKEFPAAEEFLVKQGSEITIVSDVSNVSVMEAKTHSIKLLVDGTECDAVLEIKDTTAPTLVLQTVEAWMNKPLEVNSFIDFNLTTDNSDAFEAAFAAEPDWALEGEQMVTITATDASGNSVSQTTSLLVKKDQKAPVVTVTDIDVQVGGTVSYKKAVSYYDDIDTKEEMKLAVERSGVNLNEVGSYEVHYTVTDCSGNATSVTGKINVVNKTPKWADEDSIHAKAQEILDEILKEGMTDREKAKAIYRWLKNNIGYSGHSEKGNYMRGAYEGLFETYGDCFVYAASAKELLTMAGIPNIDIVKATTNPSHYWNLVYIEDGWYHFDSTPRKDKSEFFLLTDAELEAYSSTHKNTHIFDRSLYPEIK